MKFHGAFAATLLLAASIVVIPGCSEDAATPPPSGPSIVPITDNLFPIVAGRGYVYSGYATATNGSPIADSNRVYRTSWTIAATSVPTPVGGVASAVVDSTTVPFGGGSFTGTRTLLIRKDSLGDIHFLQTIGPFKRLFGIPISGSAADTLIWVAVARPSQGVGTTGQQWTAYDSTFTGTGGSQVRLQIFGRIEAQEAITDSSAPPVVRQVYKARTWRKITLSGTVVQDDATTSRLWLEKDIGPVQIRIVEDTENIGHFRVLRFKNF